MFMNCTNLVNAPALPATSVFWASSCYYRMFEQCTSLASIPALPATELYESCYSSMFKGCTNIKISTTQTSEYNNEYRIPTNGTAEAVSYTLTSMFDATGGTFTGTPSVNTTYYTSNTVVY